MSELRVAADTSLGVVFADMRTVRSNGPVVTDKVVEKVADVYGIPVEEVYELVSIECDGRPLSLPPGPHHPRCGKAPA